MEIHKHGRSRWTRKLSVFTNALLTFIVAANLLPRTTALDYYDYSDSYVYDTVKMNNSCLNDYANVSYAGVYCEAQYNQICWPPAEPGTVTVTIDCMDALGIGSQISRTCNEDGTWEYISGEEIAYECQKYSMYSLYLALPCSLISFITCTISFIILACSRSLWCTRNYIHWHLITSFGLKYFIACINYSLYIFLDIQVHTAISMIYTYLEMASYFWMFVEGLYLHTVVALAFRVDIEKIKFYWYCVIGWGCPMLFCVIYFILRFTIHETNVAELIQQILIILPITFVLVLNSVFLLNIVRILMSKLRESSGDTQLKHYRRTARATLLLVILLGVSYVFPIFVMNLIKELPREVLLSILYINTIIGGIQGFLVSLIYVFLNAEVKSVLSRKFQRCCGFSICPRRNNDYHVASTTFSRMDDTNMVTTVQRNEMPEHRASPNTNNNSRSSRECQTLGNGNLNTNTNVENSYEMSITSGDTSTSPVNGVAKEESSPLLAGNVIINENGRTVVHDNEDNIKEQHKKGTDV